MSPQPAEHRPECDGKRQHYCRPCGSLTCACGPCDCPVEVTLSQLDRFVLHIDTTDETAPFLWRVCEACDTEEMGGAWGGLEGFLSWALAHLETCTPKKGRRW